MKQLEVAVILGKYVIVCVSEICPIPTSTSIVVKSAKAGKTFNFDLSSNLFLSVSIFKNQQVEGLAFHLC